MPASHLTNPLGPPPGVYPPRESKPTVQLLPPPEVQSRPRAGMFGAVVTQRALLAVSFALIAFTVAVYYPVHRLPFISINDGEYVTNNLHLQYLNWQTIRWAFTTYYAANWHPLTWLSHAVDYQLFALDPSGHHVINLLLHAINVVLLFWVLWRATARLGCSFMVAALFALHPINVESVAWVAERKNLLSMCFLLLALAAYRWYASKPSFGRYNVVALCFLLGLMAKPQVVTLPFLLLLWDYWPLGRVAVRPSLLAFRQNAADEVSGEKRIANSEQRDVIPARSFSWLVVEKLPLLAFSAASAVITVQAQRAGGAMGGAMRSYPLTVRIQNAIVSYAQYLAHAFWPTKLAFFYPHARSFRLVWPEAILLLLITVLALANRNRRYLAVGWLWFLGTLVPMIGLVQVGGQSMADRYAYLPFIGLFIAVCWGVADWAEERRVSEVWVGSAALAVLALLTFATVRQLSYWSSDAALWSHTVQVTNRNSGAENVLGEALQKEGHFDEAMLHFRNAAAIDPLLPFPHYHLGIYDEQHGDARGAIEQFKSVILLTQNDPGMMAELRANTLQRMSNDYESLGDSAAAERCARMAAEEQRKQRAFEAGASP